MYTVKQARQLAGYTQRGIACEMGINVDTYRRIEQYPEKASIENARKFCQVVDMTFDSIFFGSNSTLGRMNNSPNGGGEGNGEKKGNTLCHRG